MKMPFRFLALALFSAICAHSQVVLFNNMVTPSDTTHGGVYVAGSASLNGARIDSAEQFLTPLASPAFLTSVVVPFNAFGPAGLMSGTATLFADAGGSPGAVLETTGFSATLINTSPSLVTATFSGGTMLSPSTNYWIGFSMLPSSRFWALWDFAQPAVLDRVGTSVNGVAWNVTNTNAPGLTVNGRLSSVPEPATYGIFGAGAVLGLAFWRRRRSA